MTIFTPRSYPEIIGEMISRLIASTPLSDVNYGSVWTTLLEAAAQEDDEQYYQMLEIIASYSIDTVSGIDLDNKAYEYGITRLPALKASTIVTLFDSAIDKVSTTVFPGLPGPLATSLEINATSVVDFPNFGKIIIGRGTSNAEAVEYTSINDNSTYFTFNLASPLAKDHGTDETIILSQGGDRIIVAGTIVKAPATDVISSVSFILTEQGVILDGESETQANAEAVEAGTNSNVPIGAISAYDSLPFSTAMVKNESKVVNGADEESDSALQDRIKNHIQSLSRGTKKSLVNGVINVSRDASRVVSANVIEPQQPAGIVKLYIDDGTGFIPTWEGVDYEVLAIATGGERFLKSKQFPIVKAFSESSPGPWDLTNQTTLTVIVGGVSHQVDFYSNQFKNMAEATPEEVVDVINQYYYFESRITRDDRVKIFATDWDYDSIQVLGNTALGFPTDVKETVRVYLTRKNVTTPLIKNIDYKLNRYVGQFEFFEPLQAGDTVSIGTYNTQAILISGTAPYALVGGESLPIVVDGGTLQTVNFVPADFALSGAATVQEVIDRINKDTNGLTATFHSFNRISLASNTLSGGTIEVQDSTGNDILGFALGPASSIDTLLAVMESDPGPYTFTKDDAVIFVVDGITPATATCFYSGFISFTTPSTLVDNKLLDIFPDDSMLGPKFEIVYGNDRFPILSYDSLTNTITFDGTFTITPVLNDEYIIAPTDAESLVSLWNNSAITSLSSLVNISTSQNGQAVQISSKLGGEKSTIEVVQNVAELNFPFLIVSKGVSAYNYYTGLIQEVQWVVDGLEDDWVNYPGIRAAGVQVEVIEPVIKMQQFEIQIVTKDLAVGPSINAIKSTVTSYVNTLPIGGDVILSEIVRRVKNDVSSVMDIKITAPPTNVPIADNELARSTESRVVVG